MYSCFTSLSFGVFDADVYDVGVIHRRVVLMCSTQVSSMRPTDTLLGCAPLEYLCMRKPHKKYVQATKKHHVILIIYKRGVGGGSHIKSQVFSPPLPLARESVYSVGQFARSHHSAPTILSIKQF